MLRNRSSVIALLVPLAVACSSSSDDADQADVSPDAGLDATSDVVAEQPVEAAAGSAGQAGNGGSAGSSGAAGATGTGFTEVYSGATDYANVPQWHLRVMGFGDGQHASKATAEYPAYPTAEYPNTDAWYNAASDLIYLTYGGMTPRCHPAGTLF